MSQIILPPDVERELYLERQGYLAHSLERLLKDLDPNLSLVKVKHDAPAVYGLVPGCWHVKRVNEQGPDSYLPICHEDGSYMEPHAGIVTQLQKADLWRVRDVGQHFRDQQARKAKAKERKETLASEQRKDHIAEDYRAARRVAGESVRKKRWSAG